MANDIKILVLETKIKGFGFVRQNLKEKCT